MKKLFNPIMKRAFINAAKAAPKRGSKVVRVVKQALGWNTPAQRAK